MASPSDQAARILSSRNNTPKVLTSNERLRAAASISPFNTPSCMAVRTSNSIDGNPTLAAIAGPMGITVIDVLIPQRPWIVLNYASTVPEPTGASKGCANDSIHGGISTMAFQPASSTASNQTLGKDDEYYRRQSNNSILLATARGNGILIWDCSGRALSPLLGRLNASDAWSGVSMRNSQTKADNEDNAHNQSLTRPPLPPSAELTPAPSDRKNSAMSVSSASSQATSNAAASSAVDSTPLHAAQSSATSPASIAVNSLNNSSPLGFNTVKSLAWKGSSTPILLATVGSTACLFDLRTSLFSGMEDTGGGRPYARYSSDCSSALVHCSYSHDESLHIFSTLDSTGVVRLWDDRKNSSLASTDHCLESFVAHTQVGVGIAAIPPSRESKSGSVHSRWMTWGLDAQAMNAPIQDDLVVKIWDSTPKTQQSRAPTVSTVSVDEEDERDESETEGDTALNTFHLASSASMSGGAAACVHPLLPEEVLVFRSQFDSFTKTSNHVTQSPLSAAEALGDNTMTEEADNRNENSPMRVLDIALSPDTPTPSLPPMLVNDGQSVHHYKSDSKMGWEVQLLRIHHDTIENIASMEGGGNGEDALSLAPGSSSNDISSIVSVDLAHSSKELLLCTLTQKSFRVYGLPELAIKSKQPSIDSDAKQVVTSTNANVPSSVASVYKRTEPTCWWNQSEEDVFGELTPTQHAKDRSLRRGDNVDRRLSPSLPIVENITNLIAADKNIIDPEDEEVSIPPPINEADSSVAIDLSKAKLCPCPPLCGVAFGRSGTLLEFNNGPVKKLWESYLKSDLQPNQLYNEKPAVLNEVSYTSIDVTEKIEKKTAEDGHSTTPRTLFDLIEMQSSAKIAQWGLDVDNSSMLNESPHDSSTSDSDDDQSFGDCSDESQSDDSNGFCRVQSEDVEDSFVSKFDEYFASSRRSLTHIDTDMSTNHTRQTSKLFAGITSLAPSILVTNEYKNVLLNGQSVQIAQLLELGDSWWLLPDFSTPHSWEQTEKLNTHRDESLHLHSADKIFTRQPSHESSRSLSIIGNFKKLALRSPGPPSVPADQRLFKNKKQPIIPTLDLTERKPTYPTHNSEKVGMCVVEKYQTSSKAYEQFNITRNVCLRNSKILRGMGEKSKGDTWALLAQAVNSIQTFDSDDFDGWGGSNDALTTGLVEEIFQYYEAQGDYQMLATMVCVLTLGRDRRSKSHQKQYFDKCMLLPQRSPKDQIRFDNYLRGYADLLYSWGDLNTRNEISKRLSYDMPDELALCNATPGSVTIPIQCSICCSSVRGASLFCPSCGHGGHLEHMVAWFETHQTCPTGCGCICTAPIDENSTALVQ